MPLCRPKNVVSASPVYRGTSLIRKHPPPKDRHKALGISPGRGCFLMSEVPLYIRPIPKIL